MPIFNSSVHNVDIKQLCSFAQKRGAENITDEILHNTCQTLLKAMQPQGVYQQFFYEAETHSVLCDMPFVIKGHDLPQQLEQTNILIGIAATLGKAAEEIIDTAFLSRDFTKGILLDSAAVIALQSLVDEMIAYFDTIGAKKGYKVAWHCSPGTGDWPAAQARELVQAVHGETIGLSFTESGMITPRKTRTLLLGLAFSREGCAPAACSGCAMAGRCHA